MVENEDVVFDGCFDVEKCPVDIRSIYTKKKSAVMQAMNATTINLLSHTYFRNHPRTYVKYFIRSMEIFLSLDSKSAIELSSTWIERSTDKLNLCKPFPDIYNSLTLCKTMVSVKKKDYQTSILSLLELIEQDSVNPANRSEDYERTVELLNLVGKRVSNVIVQSLEKFLTIDNGVITINEYFLLTRNNLITVKIFINSSIACRAHSVSASLRYKDPKDHDKARISFSSKEDFAIIRGQSAWTFEFPCVASPYQPDICDDFIHFDKLEIKMFNAHFTLQSSSPILSHDARSYLNYRVDISKLTFVNQIESENRELQDLIVHGAINKGAALIKLNSNEVPSNLKIQLLHRTEDEIQDDVILLFLDSGKKEQHSIRSPIECFGVSDKNLAIIFSIKVKMFSDLEKKVLGRLAVQATFLTINNPVHKSTEQNLALGLLSHLKLSYQSFGHYYNLQLRNLTGVDIKVQRIAIKGADVLSDMVLQRSENYSMIHNNSILADSVVCSISYSIPTDSVRK